MERRRQFATEVGGDPAIFNRRSLVPIIPAALAARSFVPRVFLNLYHPRIPPSCMLHGHGFNIEIVLMLRNADVSERFNGASERLMGVHGEGN